MRLPRKEVVVATRNPGKAREFARMFEQIGLAARSLNDFAELPDIVEDGDTFAANAEIKAKTIARILGLPVLGDDSGLSVEALNGEPGVYSARYAGAGATDARNNEKLLLKLRELGSTVVPETKAAEEGPVHLTCLSRASFICALALYDPESDRTLFAEGVCDGYIIDEPRGEHGFGYDPLFYLPSYGLTMSELTMEQKNAVSHRGAALRQLLQLLT